jgi:hypothetical protein
MKTMKYKWRQILVCGLLTIAAACNNSKTQETHSQTTQTDSSQKSTQIPSTPSFTLNHSWYKRYAGTVGGQPVVVSLYWCINPDSTILAGGSYYYVGKSDILPLAPFSLDAADSNMLHTYENVDSMQFGNRTEDSVGKPVWDIRFDRNRVTGEWHSADKKEMRPISLTEDFTNAYPLDFITFFDSLTFDGYTASTSFVELVPSQNMNKEEADFINRSLLEFMMVDTEGVSQMKDYPAKSARKYFSDFRGEVKNLESEANDNQSGDDRSDNEEGGEGGMEDSFYRNTVLTPLYDDKGILQIELNVSAYEGGFHEIFVNHHICLDMNRKKRIFLKDILQPDIAKITAQLNAGIRKQLKLSPTEQLSDQLLVDAVPLTDNFFISDRGITFCYSPGEIAGFAYGGVMLFVPYTDVSNMLTDDFKKRMKLD